MDNDNRAARWAVYCRWFATAGAGLVLVACSLLLRPALAQPKAADKPPAARPAEGATLSQQEIDRKAEAALAESDPQRKEAGPTAAEQVNQTFDILKDIHWVSPHMWAVYAILGVSLIAVAFCIERLLGLRRSKVVPRDLVAGLRMLAARKAEFDLRHAQRLAKQYPSSTAVVVRAMLARVGRPVAEIDQAMTEAADREATRLYANVRWQNLAFNVAPMLGLAGTVHGMIIAFFVTAHMPLGTNKMESLATGIYAALVCTLAGLLVAIPAGVMSHFFEGRILRLFQELDDLTRSLMPHLERFEGRTRLKGHAESGPVGRGLAQPAAAEFLPEPPEDDNRNR
ncbi:MAG: MotA/TolQ/ExbB proton channel family protein [Thermoguttaceae bacterium]